VTVRSGRSGQTGQAAVELVAVLPVLAALLAGLWQVTLVGHASWSAAAAARAAARAHALGSDPRAAARAHLPSRLERGLRVREASGGKVTVSVRVPSVVGGTSMGRVSATTAFAAQR
jgi:Flp pilus assembly protein TadG